MVLEALLAAGANKQVAMQDANALDIVNAEGHLAVAEALRRGRIPALVRDSTEGGAFKKAR